MVDIIREEIRAEIFIGGKTFVTPAVKSFSVNRSRQSLSANFSASIEVSPGDFTTVGSDVVIRAGIKDSLKTIFTGIIKSAAAKPSWDDASKVILSISGNDRMYVLDDKKFSRRALNSGLAPWASITSVSRRQQVSQYNWKRKNVSIGKIAFLGNEKFMNDTRVVLTPEINDPLYPFISRAADKDDREIIPSAIASFVLDPLTISSTPYTGGGGTDEDGNLEDTWNVTLSSEDWNSFAGQENISDMWAVDNPSVAIITSVPESPTAVSAGTPPEGAQCKVRIIGVGQTTLKLTDDNGKWGVCTIVAMVPHTHESVATGGPAFGTFA